HLGETEVEAVEELHDHDAKDLVIAEARGHLELRQATEKAAERRICLLSSASEREELDQAPLQLRVLFEADGVAGIGDELGFGDESSDRSHLAPVAKAIADGDRLGV